MKRAESAPLHAHVSARAVRAALKALATQGLAVDTLLEFAEVDPALLEDPDNRVPYERLLPLWVAALRESGDGPLGLHAAAQVRPEDYELLGYLVRTSPSAADLLAGVTRWQRLLADAIEIRSEFEGERIRVHYGVPRGYQLPRVLAEYVIGVVVVLLRSVLGDDIAAHEVCFTHAAPADLAPHDELFGCPVRFDAPQESVLFEVDLDTRIATGDGDLHQILRRQADQIVEAAGGDTFVAHVSQLLEERILQGGLNGGATSDAIDVEQVAKALAVSTRSLRRQLGQRGTTLKDIADSMRRQLAVHYLTSSQMSVGEIGFLVGFSEPSAFHRAFKRWTNQTPAACRAQGA